ncbi:hypothetical protein MJO28_004623 [Puccinia striiformis f. sp. tritici]|uniref:Uncharacterized protein n=1 Tax=Puccinia striiformis f. sp. tritici TaxID=168172 RepID=A0ACC0EP96_9BASI|nr:hypothetical protein MJO28_004623 [Puccinia striiformis f. sp. tritici]
MDRADRADRAESVMFEKLQSFSLRSRSSRPNAAPSWAEDTRGPTDAIWSHMRVISCRHYSAGKENVTVRMSVKEGPVKKRTDRDEMVYDPPRQFLQCNKGVNPRQGERVSPHGWRLPFYSSPRMVTAITIPHGGSTLSSSVIAPFNSSHHIHPSISSRTYHLRSFHPPLSLQSTLALIPNRYHLKY